MNSTNTDQSSSMSTSKSADLPFDSNYDSLSSIDQTIHEKTETILRRSTDNSSPSRFRFEVDMADFSPFSPSNQLSSDDSDDDEDEQTMRSSYSARSTVSFNNSATVIEFDRVKDSQQHKLWFQPDELKKFKQRAKSKIEKHSRLNGSPVRTKGFYAHPALTIDPQSAASAPQDPSPMKILIGRVRRRSRR